MSGAVIYIFWPFGYCFLFWLSYIVSKKTVKGLSIRSGYNSASPIHWIAAFFTCLVVGTFIAYEFDNEKFIGLHDLRMFIFVLIPSFYGIYKANQELSKMTEADKNRYINNLIRSRDPSQM